MKTIRYTKRAIGAFYLLLASLFVLSFTACSDDDESAAVGLHIKTFFPLKVVTNQPVTISGSGFNGTTEVVFPGGIKANSFEIVNDGMIRVNTPAGLPAEGGKVIVRTDNGEAESRLDMTVGHTVVSGFSKQPGEVASGGELITVFGTDLEFINGVELLDPDSLTQVIDHKDFYRKGTSNLIFRVPPKNIYDGTFTGYLLTYDGQRIPLPELTYEPAADGGHYEIVKTVIWKNDGSHGGISWSGEYRYGLEGHDGNNECVATFPADVWEKLKTQPFKVLLKGENPQIRVTSGWWSTTWTGDDIFPGNERLEDNGDGTFILTVDLAGDPLVDVLDDQHLLLTGDRYTVEEIYFEEEIWVDGGGDQEVKNSIWKNDGSGGAVSWNGIYRFGLDGHDGNNECIATFPQDIWDRLKTETFYVVIAATDPQIRVTSGWWSTTWTGDDIFPGNERLADNGDGTFTLTVNLTGDPLVDVLDDQHLLFTGSGYSVEEIYFIEIVHGGGGGGSNETVFWQGDGSAGAVSWNGTYRFALEGHDYNNECIGEFPQDVWDKIKTTTFYLVVEATDPQIRVTNGWWDTQWQSDFQPGNELLTDNGDGTWTLEINIAGDPLVDTIDEKHILFTGDRFTPLKLYFK